MSQSLRTTLSYILRHPLNRDRPARALSRPGTTTARCMLDHGFRLYRYDPASRALAATEEIIGGNNLYVRDADILRERVRTAPLHEVHGTRI